MEQAVQRGAPTARATSGAPVPQRGAALITALLVMVVVTGIAVELVARQSQALTRTQRAQEAAQAAHLMHPLLDYVRDGMRQSFAPGKPVGLGQAQGIAALTVEGGTASGRLIDQGGRFNLNNLVKDGKTSPTDLAVFRRLLVVLELDPGLAQSAADWIDADDETQSPGGQENPLYFALGSPRRAANRALVHASELARAKGFDEASLNRLAPFVTALPVRTKINVNTAPREVLAAALPEVDGAALEALLRRRAAAPFKDVAAAAAQLKGTAPASLALLDVSSDYFLADVALELGATRLVRAALLKRNANGAAEGWPTIIWARNSF
jgi:general secretion pathway protein K